MVKKIQILLLTAWVLSLASCLQDDFSGCPYGIRLKLYRFQDGEPVRFQNNDADRVVVYAFNEQGVYLEKYSVAGTELINGNEMLLPLRAGKYNLVTWAGKLDDYTVMSKNQDGSYVPLQKGVTTIDQFRFYLNGIEITGQFDPNKEVEVNHPENLYYGRSENVVALQNCITEEREDLTRDSKEIRVKVVGVSNLFPGVLPVRSVMRSKAGENLPLAVYCTATNGMYNYLNAPDTYSYRVKYLMGTAELVNDTFSASTKVLRMLRFGDLRIQIIGTGMRSIIIDQNAIDLIMNSPQFANVTQEILDRQDVYEFEFRISKNLDVSIKVNGWEISNVIPLL